MTDKAIISAYTYRSPESQRANAGDMPVFILPDDMPQIFRSTTRKTRHRLHVDSLAVIAPKETMFREFLEQAKVLKAEIVSRDEGRSFIVNGNCEMLVKVWKQARRNDAGKIGADEAARLRREESKKGCEAIRSEWSLPSKKAKTADLLRKANTAIGKRGKMHYRTAVSFLGSRPIAQYNYEAARGSMEARTCLRQ